MAISVFLNASSVSAQVISSNQACLRALSDRYTENQGFQRGKNLKVLHAKKKSVFFQLERCVVVGYNSVKSDRHLLSHFQCLTGLGAAVAGQELHRKVRILRVKLQCHLLNHRL